MSVIILIVGDPVNGFQFIGPFDSEDDAIRHGDIHYSESTWTSGYLNLPEFIDNTKESAS